MVDRFCERPSSVNFFQEFANKFTAALNSGCTITPKVKPMENNTESCIANELSCGDWSSADWYCSGSGTHKNSNYNNHIKSYTYSFTENGENYSVQAWLEEYTSENYRWLNTYYPYGPKISFKLYHNGKAVTEVKETEKKLKNLDYFDCRFWGRPEEITLLQILDRGFQMAIGENLEITILNSCGNEDLGHFQPNICETI